MLVSTVPGNPAMKYFPLQIVWHFRRSSYHGIFVSQMFVFQPEVL
jgi:hypothetical protein